MFSRIGLPDVLVTDNVPQFVADANAFPVLIIYTLPPCSKWSNCCWTLLCLLLHCIFVVFLCTCSSILSRLITSAASSILRENCNFVSHHLFPSHFKIVLLLFPFVLFPLVLSLSPTSVSHIIFREKVIIFPVCAIGPTLYLLAKAVLSNKNNHRQYNVLQQFCSSDIIK